MASYNISEIIKELLLQNKEGSYWDFKQEYGNNKTDMLHDIICMANQTSHKGDRYLIYGIAENDSSFAVQGLTTEKTQADLLDYLRCQQFAVCTPDINLIALTHENKKLNVIIIKDKPLKPYYLLEDIKESNRTVLRAGAIYTRTGDTNTPKNKTANMYEIEQMWRERFGIDMPTLERFSLLMHETEHWENVITQYETLYYHKHFPEFRIVMRCKEESKEMPFGTAYTVFYMNEAVHDEAASLYFHSTLVKTIHLLSCDGARVSLVNPCCQQLREMPLKLSTLPNNPHFYYYLKDSVEFSLLKIVNQDNSSCWDSQNQLENDGILVFQNKQHVEQFTQYLIENLDDNVEHIPREVYHDKYVRLQPIVDFQQKCYVVWKRWQAGIIV